MSLRRPVASAKKHGRSQVGDSLGRFFARPVGRDGGARMNATAALARLSGPCPSAILGPAVMFHCRWLLDPSVPPLLFPGLGY